MEKFGEMLMLVKLNDSLDQAAAKLKAMKVGDKRQENDAHAKGHVVEHGQTVRVPMSAMDAKPDAVKDATPTNRLVFRDQAFDDDGLPASGFAQIVARLDDATAAEAKYPLGLINSNDAPSIRNGIGMLSALLRSRDGMVASGLVMDSATVSALRQSVVVLEVVVSTARDRLHELENARR